MEVKMKKTKKSLGRMIKSIFLGSVLIGLIGIISLAFITIQGAPDIEAFEKIEGKNVPTKVYDAAGNQIDQFNNGQWGLDISLEQVPKHMQEAMIVLEDERFYEHKGIDFKKIGTAIFSNLKKGELTSGGTTITQQVVRNNMAYSASHKIVYKLQEQYLALQLEKRYSKEQILEWYLNEAGFGQGTVGVQAAANRYFGKDISQLSLAETVVIAVIPQYPTYYNPILNPENNWEKAQVCLEKLAENGYITEEERAAALEAPPYEAIHRTQAEYAEHTVHKYVVEAAIEQVKEDLKELCGYTDLEVSDAIYGGGLQIDTTIDSHLQQIVDQYLGEKSDYIKEAYEIVLEYSIEATDSKGERIQKEATATVKRQDEIEAWKAAQKKSWGIINEEDVINEQLIQVPQPQVGFVLMDYKTGEVKALSGGIGKEVNRGLNYATQALRAPGTTFNILAAYAPALDMGTISPETIVEDAPLEITLENGAVYSPRNLDGKYNGKMTVREAICNPRNVVTTKVLKDKVGVDKAFEYLQKFGFKHLEESDKVVALAQGALTKGVTALELNAAYSAIANGGNYIAPILYREVRNAKGEVILKNSPQAASVIKEETAKQLTKMLQAAIKEGEGSRIEKYFSTQSVAGEVGIASQDMDMIFVGYTPDYSATIWTGYSKPKALDETVRNYQLDIWAQIMNDVHK